MKKLFFVIVAIITWSISIGQKQETIYLNQQDSTIEKFLAINPETQPIKAFMFCIPGAFQTPQYVLQQTDFPIDAAKNGILTIIPTFSTGTSSFGIDSLTQLSLKKMLDIVVVKYKLKDKDFYIGGLSIGGSCAIKYAELAVQKNYAIKPKAVFGIDPPLDFERYYNSAKRIIRLSEPTQVNEEIPYMISRIEQEMQGNPKSVIENFYQLSPYSMSDTSQSAIKNLVNIPIMLIMEPDIEWWLKNRNYDYMNINAIDEAGMINELQRLGNTKAKLIITSDKGYRKPNNVRHPHSWSIVDSSELINWLTSENKL